MLNLIRKFLRPTLREQLEAGVREALRRYADRHTAPNLRVFVSTDLVTDGVDANLWARDESEHLRRFALQWAQDNSVPRAGIRLETVLLDTKRQFAFVKPMGLDTPDNVRSSPVAAAPAESGSGVAMGGGGSATLEVIESPSLDAPIRFTGEVTLGRKADSGVQGVGDRYMSSRHARLHVDAGRLWVTDLDSKNRTFLNDNPLPPHQAHPAAVGDRIRMGTTTLRVARIAG